MIEINNKTEYQFDFKKIEEVAAKFLDFYKVKNKNVSLAIVDDERIQELNKQYRCKDKVTDVLSFCYENEDLGEIIINYDQIKRQAKDFSNSFEAEFLYIMVHGLLHLLGFCDDTKEAAEEMKKKGDEFINLCLK